MCACERENGRTNGRATSIESARAPTRDRRKACEREREREKERERERERKRDSECA